MNAAGRNGFYQEGDRRLLAYVERPGEGAHNDPAHACSGKFRHAAWRAAAAEAQRLTLKGLGQCRAYRCVYCDRWHVGHAQPAAARADQTEPAPPVGPPSTPSPPPASPPTTPQPQEPLEAPGPAAGRRPTRSREDYRQQYAEVVRLVGEGRSLREACERVGVHEGRFREALARERARLSAGADAASAPARAGPSAAPRTLRPIPPRPAARTGPQMYVLLYNRWSRRRHEPAWAAVPGPRLANARPVLRLEHLALLTDAERRALFPAPATQSIRSAGGVTAGARRTLPGAEQGARQPW